MTDKGTVQVDFTAPLTGPAYMAIPGTEEQLPIDVVVDGELYAQYFEPESLGGVICLPSFTAGQHVTMVLGIADDEVFHTNTQIYQARAGAPPWPPPGSRCRMWMPTSGRAGASMCTAPSAVTTTCWR